MKVMQVVPLVLISTLLGPLMPAGAQDADADQQATSTTRQEPSRPESGQWDVAGQEIKEAAGAVAGATRKSAGTAWDALKSGSTDVWGKTRDSSLDVYETVEETSKETWQSVREGSQELWEKGKAKVHEATVPEAPAAASPVPPASPSPSVPPEQSGVPAASQP